MLQNTSPAIAVSASRTYSNRSNCVAGARAVLGKAAKIGVDFVVDKVGERFAWAPVQVATAKPKQDDLKAPGGLLALATAMDAPDAGSPGPAILTAMVNEPMRKDDKDDDGLGIPAILKRDDDDEARAALARARKRATGGGDGRPAIKNPPNVKTKPREVANFRPDGLRQNSKQSVMLDMVLRASGATEAEICKKLGWKACLVTLRRTCERVGVELRREPGKDGGKSRYFGVVKSDAKGRRS